MKKVRTYTHEEVVEMAAKKLALDYLNENRAKSGRPLLNHVVGMWWNRYKDEWIKKARESLKPVGQP